MPTFTLSQAAEETGKSKSVIYRALNNGTLSGHKDEKGEYQIEASELFRVYERKNRKERGEERSRTPVRTAWNGEENASHFSTLEVENKLLHLRLVDKEERIQELREERDRAIAEKDRWHDQAQRLLLTYQPASKSPEMPLQSENEGSVEPTPLSTPNPSQNSNTAQYKVIAAAVLVAGLISLLMNVFDAPIRAAIDQLVGGEENSGIEPVKTPEPAKNVKENGKEPLQERPIEPQQSFPQSLPLPVVN